MKLYLLRHGIAVDRIGGPIQNDFQRPLTEEGCVETRMVAQGLKRLKVNADLVVASPLIRARQTAEIVGEILGKQKGIEICDALAPGSNASDIYKFLRKFKDLQEVFLVGHEPDMGRLAGTLLWSGPELNIPFKKAGVCRIDVSDIPPTHPGILKWFLTPKIISQFSKNGPSLF